jgi:hypothetical protein
MSFLFYVYSKTKKKRAEQFHPGSKPGRVAGCGERGRAVEEMAQTMYAHMNK